MINMYLYCTIAIALMYYLMYSLEVIVSFRKTVEITEHYYNK